MKFRPISTGFFGKLPTKGDFLRASLPEDFVASWDAWCRDCLACSRAELGEGWDEAWMSGPIWRFLLPPGAVGAQAALGVWLPSMDKVGRHYPFMVCALAESVADLEQGGVWAEAAEAAGLSGVAQDLPQESIAVALRRPVADGALQGPGWWTEGSPFVRPKRFQISALLPTSLAGVMVRDPEVAEP